MIIEPGFGGQKIITACLDKVSELRRSLFTKDIQVDGGIDASNIDIVAQSGANVIVSGTGIFGSKDPAAVIKMMQATVHSCQVNY